MKKNKNFCFFGSVKISALRRLALFPAAIILLAALFALFSFSDSLTLVSIAVRAATKTAVRPTDESIARAMVKLSLPAVSLSKITAASPKDEPSEAEEDEAAPQSAEEPLSPPPENNAESVTYSKAEEKGYRSSEGIYINNQTDKTVDIDSLLNLPLDLKSDGGPQVLIVHTHTSESYTPSEKYNYIPSDTDRTEDINFNMVSVGESVYTVLTEAGIEVIHDKSINDYPSYSGSYSKTLKLIESYVQKYPSIKIVLDIHRDAIVRSDGTKIRTAATIDGIDAAQIMFVVGTDQSGLSHPFWKDNLAFAIRIQHKMNELYPSLARPINLRKQRFNQHETRGSLIVEVGTNGNTLDEAKYGASLFAKALAEVLEALES